MNSIKKITSNNLLVEVSQNENLIGTKGKTNKIFFHTGIITMFKPAGIQSGWYT